MQGRINQDKSLIICELFALVFIVPFSLFFFSSHLSHISILTMEESVPAQKHQMQTSDSMSQNWFVERALRLVELLIAQSTGKTFWNISVDIVAGFFSRHQRLSSFFFPPLTPAFSFHFSLFYIQNVLKSMTPFFFIVHLSALLVSIAWKEEFSPFPSIILALLYSFALELPIFVLFVMME